MALYTSKYKGKVTPAMAGGKGAALFCMKREKLPVPPFVVIPTEAYRAYCKDPVKAVAAVKDHLDEIKKFLIAEFGYMPLVSVRSSGTVSMPGMMDTILNVGLTGLDGLDHGNFDEWRQRLGEHCATQCAKILTDGFYKASHASVLGVGQVVGAFKTVDEQLVAAIVLVWQSANSERAQVYRKVNNIVDTGTAVVIQAMVFGNHNDKSCTGVVFSRSPDDGTKALMGEFLVNAQGEILVGGAQQGKPISLMHDWNPHAYMELGEYAMQLEGLKGYPQDIEFTVQDGKLWLLQTRDIKATAQAAIRIAVDDAASGMALKDVCARVTRKQYALATLARIDPKYSVKPFITGIGASPGLAYGKVVFDSAAAIDCSEPCILVREETSPDDIAGMAKAAGVLTVKGGMTSHAAVIARGMNKPCVVGVGAGIEEVLADLEGVVLTIDGSAGAVYFGQVPLVGGDPALLLKFDELMFKALDATPLNEVVKGSGTIVLDVSEELLLDQEQAFNKVQLALGAAEQVMVLCQPVNYQEVEQNFYGMLGGVRPVESFIKKLASLVEKDRITVIGYKLEGMKSLPSCMVWSDVVMAEKAGLLLMPVDEALRWVLQRKQEEGFEKFYAFGTVPGVKSIMSKEQAMATLLG